MKRSLFICAALVLAASCSGCVRKSSPAGSSFDADTLRGATATFSAVESGIVTLKPGAFDLLGDVDDAGVPKFFTSDAVASFSRENSAPLRDGAGIAIRFAVPKIADNDYCVISAEVVPPSPVDTGNGPAQMIPADFRYDAKNSGRTEYIWFIFSRSAPKFMVPGKWTITLFNKGVKLVSAEFSVR